MLGLLVSIFLSWSANAAPAPHLFLPEVPLDAEDVMKKEALPWVCMAQGENLHTRQPLTVTGQGTGEEKARGASLNACSGSALISCRVSACFEKEALEVE